MQTLSNIKQFIGIFMYTILLKTHFSAAESSESSKVAENFSIFKNLL